MDEFGANKPSGQDRERPIPFDDGLEVSHSPLNLGGGATSEKGETEAPPQPVEREIGKRVSWPDRITGVKNFYTKLHAGAIDFLDEQICKWLADNPGVNIKRTNTVTGDIVGKKTEPNIIITIWY
jgi:DNA-binding Lrp family transcriptional regulator